MILRYLSSVLSCVFTSTLFRHKPGNLPGHNEIPNQTWDFVLGPDPASYQGYSLPGRPWSNHARSPLMLRTVHLHAEPTPYPVGAGCYRQLTPAVGVRERREIHSHPFNHLDAAVSASRWLITGCRPVAMTVGGLKEDLQVCRDCTPSTPCHMQGVIGDH